MARSPNPYRPGFNQPPEVLAGRDDVLAAAREALDVAALDGRTPRPLVLVGSRGVGKTVLLGEIAVVAASEHGWLTVHTEVRPGTPFTAQLLERLEAARELLAEAPPPARFRVDGATARASLLGMGGEVELSRAPVSRPAPDLDLDRCLAAACAAAAGRGSGLMVTIDELQLARRAEVGDLAATLQQHVPDHWPLVVAVAGLPAIRSADRSVTYLERGEWHELGLLDHADTLLALTGPAAGAGRPLTPEAAESLADASGGYPYAVQVLGHHAWRCSAGADRIDAGHAAEAIPRAYADMAGGLFASRWEGASPKEQAYLTAVAALITGGGTATGGDVARTLGATPKELSYLRDRLLKKGTLVAVGRTLRFPVPGMGDWILDQTR